MKGEHHNRGVLSHYELELELEIWEPAAATHRTAPATARTRVEARAPAARGAQVLPGAFFAVMYDPVDGTAIPFTLLTREGVQFSV